MFLPPLFLIFTIFYTQRPIIFLKHKSDFVRIISDFWLNLLRDYTWNNIWTSFSWLTGSLCFGFNYLTSVSQALSFTHSLSHPHWCFSRFANTTAAFLLHDCTDSLFYIHSSNNYILLIFQPSTTSLKTSFTIYKSRYPLLISISGHCSCLLYHLSQVTNILLVDLALHSLYIYILAFQLK